MCIKLSLSNDVDIQNIVIALSILSCLQVKEYLEIIADKALPESSEISEMIYNLQFERFRGYYEPKVIHNAA